MRSWPALYLPPALGGIQHPNLSLKDSYRERRIEVTGDAISIYVCGITPYDATHLGHAATYLTFDLIHRYLIASGKQVHFTQNVTDIDDPLLERARRDGLDWRELATSQINLFRDDMTDLHVLPPTHYEGVIESMVTIVGYIQRLIDRNICYWIDRDLYLDLSQVEGALENLPISLEDALRIFSERGGDPSREGKRHPLDTLLWQGEREGEPAWDAPFGRGRPGWHIECVAIALETLPRSQQGHFTINLQGGGNDLRFPHHYMTGVQAGAITGTHFAAAYLHTGMISWQGAKMSKSLGNLLFVSKILQEGCSPDEIRLALIDRRYDEDFEWRDDQLLRAKSLLERLRANLAREQVAPTLPIIQTIVDSLANDLDVPSAIAQLISWCDETEAGSVGGSAGELSRAIDLYLGLVL